MWGIDPLWFGAAEIGLGLIFCFVGQTAARVIIGIWGALVGFVAGNELYLYLQVTFDNALGAIPWWVVALATALLVAWLAFAFYAAGVLVSMGTAGWGGGLWLAGVLGLTPETSLMLSAIGAVGLVMIGLLVNLPRLLLVVITAALGAGFVMTGLQQILGYTVDWSSQSSWQLDPTTHIIWGVAFVALAGAGAYLQLRQKSDDNLRDSYDRS